SKWIKSIDARYRGFFWQRGYGAFSVSPSQLEAVVKYVAAQQNHHRGRTFQEEYRELMRKHGVAFDERYVWDGKDRSTEPPFHRLPTPFSIPGPWPRAGGEHRPFGAAERTPQLRCMSSVCHSA